MGKHCRHRPRPVELVSDRPPELLCQNFPGISNWHYSRLWPWGRRVVVVAVLVAPWKLACWMAMGIGIPLAMAIGTSAKNQRNQGKNQ